MGNEKVGALCICKELNFQQYSNESTLSYVTNLELSFKKYSLPFITIQSKKSTRAYETFKTALQSKKSIVIYGEKGTGKTRLVYEYIKNARTKEDHGLVITGEFQLNYSQSVKWKKC